MICNSLKLPLDNSLELILYKKRAEPLQRLSGSLHTRCSAKGELGRRCCIPDAAQSVEPPKSDGRVVGAGDQEGLPHGQRKHSLPVALQDPHTLQRLHIPHPAMQGLVSGILAHKTGRW